MLIVEFRILSRFPSRLSLLLGTDTVCSCPSSISLIVLLGAKSTCLYFQELYTMAINIALQLYEYSQPFTYIVWYGLLEPV